MRFALIDNTRIEAQSKQQGFCPSCSQPVIAKCGNKKGWHWAYRSAKSCDSWWEPETEWHRNWESNYPTEWQEIPLFDELTGERDTADVWAIRNIDNKLLRNQSLFGQTPDKAGVAVFYSL